MASLPFCSSALCLARPARGLCLHHSVPLNLSSGPRPSPPTAFIKGPSQSFIAVRAMEVSGPGSIESSLINSMIEKLKEQLNTSDVVVKDAYGDGRHVSIEVVSAEFEGKTSVNRQRMVYKALWEELQTTVHAVDSMRTLTPEEATLERLQQSS